MNCEEVLEILSEYIDGELEDDTEELVNQHIHECERCFALLHTIEKTISLSKEWYKEETYQPPKTIVRKIYYEIRIKYEK